MRVLLGLCLLGVLALASGQCPRLVTSGREYDLTPLTRTWFTGDWKYQNGATGRNYFMNICAPTVTTCHPSRHPSAVCQQGVLDNAPKGVATFTSAEYFELPLHSGVLISYNVSDYQCSDSQVETTEVRVECDTRAFPTKGEILQVVWESKQCRNVVHFRSVYGCPIKAATATPAPGKPAPRTPVASPSPIPVNPGAPAFALPTGVTSLGQGFNMFTKNKHPQIVGAPVASMVAGNGYTYAQNKSFGTHHGSYSVPDQVTVSSANEGFGVHSFAYQNMVSYMDQVAKDYSFSLGTSFHHIPLGISAYYSNLNETLRRNGGSFSFIRENIPLYTLRLRPGTGLSPEFASAVQALGSNPSTSDFDDLVDRFGSHVQVGLDMGGMMWFGGAASASQMSSQTTTTVQAGIKVAFANIKLPALELPFLGHNRKTVPTYTRGFDQIRLGGDTSIPVSLNDWYTKWVTSVPKYPSRINYQLESIEEYIRMVDRRVADRYSSYIEKRLDAIDNNGYTAQDMPIYLKSSDRTSPEGQGTALLTGMMSWSDDDDEYYWGSWYTSSTDAQAYQTYRKPLVTSWQLDGTFGSAPMPLSAAEQAPATRVLRTTELIQTHNNCGDLPCIPGLSKLGIGYDIITGAVRLPALEWTFNQGKTWRGFDGVLYGAPDQLALDSDTSAGISSRVYNSYSEYSRNASNAVSNGWDGLFFEWGSEVSSTESVYDRAQSVLGVGERKYVMYTLEPTGAPMLVDPSFAQALSELPTQYEPATYLNFIMRWGTHVSNGGSFGGRARLFTMMDQEYYTAHTEQTLEKNLGLQFKGWEGGASWGNDGTSTVRQLTASSFQWLQFYGGDASLALTNQWTDWVQSTHYAPTMVFNDLIPIQQLVSNSAVANGLAQAVSSYRDTVRKPAVLPVYKSLALKLTSGSSYYQAPSRTYTWTHYSGLTHTTVNTKLVQSVTTAGIGWSIPSGYLQLPNPYPVNSSRKSNFVSSKHEATCPANSWVRTLSKQRCTHDTTTTCYILSPSITCAGMAY